MKRNFKITKNNKPIPVQPGQFNDCWDVEYQEPDGYGNWIDSGFSIDNETYCFFEKHFKLVKTTDSITES